MYWSGSPSVYTSLSWTLTGNPFIHFFGDSSQNLYSHCSSLSLSTHSLQIILSSSEAVQLKLKLCLPWLQYFSNDSFETLAWRLQRLQDIYGRGNHWSRRWRVWRNGEKRDSWLDKSHAGGPRCCMKDVWRKGAPLLLSVKWGGWADRCDRVAHTWALYLSTSYF